VCAEIQIVVSGHSVIVRMFTLLTVIESIEAIASGWLVITSAQAVSGALVDGGR